eukprot:s322_g11.t1
MEDRLVPVGKPPVEKVETGVVTSGKATRVVEIYNQDETECITIGASGSTRTPEVCDIISSFVKIPPDKIQLVSKVGVFPVKQRLSDEVASKVIALGVKSFQRPVQQYPHPIVVIGAGLGGMQTMISFKKAGRKDLICLERLGAFGGHSWIVVSNKYTKLQTESGNYHVDFMLPDAPATTEVEGDVYKTWPTRDQLLKMFRDAARIHELGPLTRFHTHVDKIRPLPDGSGYAVHTFPSNSEDAEGELIVASAVITWPGNLCKYRELEWPGEEDFGGYIAYASFSMVDYREAEGKVCILYGHGAFTIENVRTLCEHRCKKVIVMCRKRNLCGMRVMSWLVGFLENPVPGTILLEGFQKMYDLVGFDCWSAHCVKTDEKRSYAQITQRTAFGVTDVYFLAGYYGLMEVLVDEIKRLTSGCAQTKKGKKIKCQLILKAVGVTPDPQKDKMLGLKELVGLWVNGDPLRPVCCNGFSACWRVAEVLLTSPPTTKHVIQNQLHQGSSYTNGSSGNADAKAKAGKERDPLEAEGDPWKSKAQNDVGLNGHTNGKNDVGLNGHANGKDDVGLNGHANGKAAYKSKALDADAPPFHPPVRPPGISGGLDQTWSQAQMTSEASAALDARMADHLLRSQWRHEHSDAAYRILGDLKAILREQDHQGEVKIFGSCATSFRSAKSDLDVTYTGDVENGRVMSTLATVMQSLKDRGYENVTKVFTTQTRLVKFTDPSSNMEVDFCLQNDLGIRNSKMLECYCRCDYRVQMLGRLVKDWAKRFDIVSSTDGCLNSYAYMLMVLYYLQSLQPEVIPNLQQMASAEGPCQIQGRDGWCETKFFEQVDDLPRSENKSSVADLLYGFFRFYSEEFDWSQNAVCIREGRPAAVVDKFGLSTKTYYEQWYIEDPFDLQHNLGGKCSQQGKDYIIRQMQCAKDELSKAIPDLAKVCGPPPERNSFFLRCRCDKDMTPEELLDAFRDLDLVRLHFPTGGHARQAAASLNRTRLGNHILLKPEIFFRRGSWMVVL